MKRTYLAVVLLSLILGTSVNAQEYENTDKPKYELRNQDFVRKRRVSTEDNFAKLYYKASQDLNTSVLSKKTGDAWTPIGPSGNEQLAGMGRVNSMQIHPTDTNTWFICVAQGGLWKTTNAGQSWTSISSDLPITRTSYLAIDPNDPDIMYVALGDYAYLGHNLQANENKRNSHYGIGVYKTTDGGDSWLPTGLSFKQTDFEGSLIAKVFIDQSNSSRLIAVGQTGSYYSENGGDDWTQSSTKLFWDLEQHPSIDSILYATTGYVHSYGIGEVGILRSTNFGKSWSTLNSGMPTTGLIQRVQLAIAPSDPNYIYAIACDTLGGFYGFYRSINAGASFTQMLDNSYQYNILSHGFDKIVGGQGRYDLAICVDRYDKGHVLIGGINVWHTENGGQSFSPLTLWSLNYSNLSLHADVHEIRQHPTNDSYFACHDGGLSRTFELFQETPSDLSDGIVHTKWTNYIQGLNITSFYRLSINTLNSNEKIAGAQDNSTVYTNGSVFYNVSGGDGMESAFMDDHSFRYTSSQNGNIYTYLSSNGDFIYYGRLDRPLELGEWTTPFVVANDRLYVLFGNVHSYYGDVAVEQHSSFSNMPNRSYPLIGTALAVERSNGSTIYAAKRGYNSLNIENEIWSTSDGGDNWSDASTDLPRDLYPSYLELNQSNASEAWICFSGFDSSRKIFHTLDRGSSWTNITYDLPNIPVNCVVHQNDGTGTIYIGTDLGVFYLLANTTNWVHYSKDLPPVIVSELEIDTAKETLVAATFGRGLWEVGLLNYQSRGTEDLNADNIEMRVHPNPASDVINVEIDKKLTNLDIKVVDVSGQCVLSGYYEKGSSDQMIPFNISDLLSGTYYMIIKSEGRRYVKQFVKL